MSFINYHSKEINCKIVYCGPGMGGKTTNIQYIYKKISQQTGDLITLAPDNERTLFFDFLPVELGEVQGFKTRFHLYSVPGQVFYESSRKLVLRGVDGVVFVADSQVERIEDNIISLNDLEQNLNEQGHDLNKVPLVFQWNKRDLPNIMPTFEMNDKLNRYEAPSVEAEAVNGTGVTETLKIITKKVLANLKSGIN